MNSGQRIDAFVHRQTTVVLDRHPLWLTELEQILERAGFELVGSTTSEARALQLLRQHQPGVLIFEPEACTSTSARFVTAARSAAPQMKAIAVSTVDDPDVIRATLQDGAWAYVLKQAQPEDIAVAVRQAFSHSIHLARTLDLGGAATTPHRDNTSLAVLTRREREILVLVAEGQSNAAMARELWVTEQTVKFHLSNIYRKLGVSNRTAASRWAHGHGVVSAAPVAGEPAPA